MRIGGAPPFAPNYEFRSEEFKQELIAIESRIGKKDRGALEQKDKSGKPDVAARYDDDEKKE